MRVPKIVLGLGLALIAIYCTAFILGALAGWQYGSRHKVCAVLPNEAGVSVPVCDYSLQPPPGAFEQ